MRKVIPGTEEKVCVGILGSTSFFDRTGTSENVCKAIGQEISKRNKFFLISGGLSGVAETAVVNVSDENRVINILPIGTPRVIHYGKHLECGRSMEERRTELAQVCSVYFMVEGGPGTVDEAEKVLSLNPTALLIPITKTGGACSGMFFNDANSFINRVENRMKEILLKLGADEKLIDLYKQEIANPSTFIEEIFNCFDV